MDAYVNMSISNRSQALGSSWKLALEHARGDQDAELRGTLLDTPWDKTLVCVVGVGTLPHDVQHYLGVGIRFYYAITRLSPPSPGSFQSNNAFTA